MSIANEPTVKAYLDHYRSFLEAGGDEIPLTEGRAAWVRWQDESARLWAAIPMAFRIIDGKRNPALDTMADAVEATYRKRVTR